MNDFLAYPIIYTAVLITFMYMDLSTGLARINSKLDSKEKGDIIDV